ncbi:PIN domain-containing protein [Patescibacteria group bacterium]|nr:PIN domain-containing protein [Patescibacteria group bacterium]
MGKIQVFLDTDVVISALLSKTGASYELIRNPLISKIISKTVKKEIEEVKKRLNIDNRKVEKLLERISTASLNLTKKEVSEEYKKFVLDEKDSHVVAGANKTKSKFLLTHNLKHYRVNKINTEFGILVLKPGMFLQYLRSLDKF